METQDLELALIQLYGGTQTRVETHDDAISAYAEEMESGAVFPPIVTYFDGATYWLADGFHRYLAAKRNGYETIACEVRAGGRTDALRFALGANATNGLFRNQRDKRNVVEIALEEWPDLANANLAELCKVSPTLVGRVRRELEKAERIPTVQTVKGRDGREYPAAIERQPRGKTEKTSRDQAGGGAGGRGKKGGDAAPGGSTNEIEADARAMARKGEINPFELVEIFTANGHDYAESAINLLGRMPPELKHRREGLERVHRWLTDELSATPTDRSA
jgi:uncharacterized ParB-like nuclease family protein